MKPKLLLPLLGFTLLYSSGAFAQTRTTDSAYTAQAVAKYNQALYAEAISLCDIVVKRNPNYSWALNIRGLANAGLGANEKTKNKGVVNDKTRQYYGYAINDYTKAVTLDATYRVAFANRATAHYALRDFDNAIKDWAKVIALDPKNIEAWRERGNSYYSNSDYKNAIADYNQAIFYDPQNKWNYFNRGVANYYLKNYKEAIPDFTITITLDPKYIDAYNYRGLCYYNLKEDDNAIQDYGNVIKLDPFYQVAYYNRALVYDAQKQYSKAVDDYTSAININKSYLSAYNGRGLAYEGLGEHAKAKADYLEAIKLDKSYKWPYYNIGMIYYNQNKHDSAIMWFSEAIKVDPKFVDAYIDRGWSNFSLKEYEKAVGDCSMAIALDKNVSNAYNTRGIVYSITGRYSEAIADFKSTIAINDNYTWAYINILIPLVQTGDYKQAKSYYNTYLEKKMDGYMEHARWKFLKTYLLASMYQIDNGEFQKAQQLLQDANKQYTDYITAHSEVLEGTKIYIAFVFSKLGITYERLNSYTEAKSYFNKALLINPNVIESQQALARIENRSKSYASTDKTPPTFRLLPPRDTITFEGTDKATIIGKASDPAGIAWIKVDGKNVDGLEEDGTFFVDVVAKTGKQSIDFEVQDKAGNNFRKSIITSINRGGRVSQSADALSVAGARFYGLFISAEKYADPTIMTLNHPNEDAKRLKDLLVKNYTFREADITLLPDKSREDILEAISTTVEKMGPNDNLLIFFAGHGTYKAGVDPRDNEGYLMPVTAKKGKYSTYISASDLTTAIKNCKAKHLLLLTDACYSGSLVRRSITENNAIELQYKYKSRQLMASGNLEPVPDNSKFIFYLLKRLEENTDMALTADDLFARLKNATINNTSGKTLPICAAIMDVGDEGGQFVFIKK